MFQAVKQNRKLPKILQRKPWTIVHQYINTVMALCQFKLKSDNILLLSLLLKSVFKITTANVLVPRNQQKKNIYDKNWVFVHFNCYRAISSSNYYVLMRFISYPQVAWKDFFRHIFFPWRESLFKVTLLSIDWL